MGWEVPPGGTAALCWKPTAQGSNPWAERGRGRGRHAGSAASLGIPSPWGAGCRTEQASPLKAGVPLPLLTHP